MNGHVPQSKPRDWLCICDVCGFVKYASELRRRWDGYMVCADDFEERHPQDYVKSKQDHQRTAFTRSEPADQFVPQVQVDPSLL